MLFDIEEDQGHRIVGYLVPDSYSNTPTVRVVASGMEIASVKADVIRSSVVIAGRHATGCCGFILTDKNVPNLSKLTCLELCDSETNLAIYRRRPLGSLVRSKLFRLESQHERLVSIDEKLDRHFQLSFPGVDRNGRETTAQSLLLKSSSSLYVSARLLYREYEYSLDASFRKVCLLQDPCRELAQTIVALANSGSDEASPLSLRDELAFGACAEYIQDLDIADPEGLRRGLSQMPAAVESVLSNPLAKSLAAHTRDEIPNATYVSNSLDVLSSFEIVGLRECAESFIDPLSELLGLDRDQLPSIEPPDISTMEMAEVLRGVPAVLDLLELDLEIYGTVRDAVVASF